jgi:predicted nuclease with TOPRIM domain
MGLFNFLKKKEFEEINQLRSQLEKYKPINDIESEVERQKMNLEQLISSKNSEITSITENFTKLNSDYQSALETYTKLRKEVSLFENKFDLIEFGIYEPIYSFEKSDEFRVEQSKIIELQKQMISSERAAICRINWTIDGSEAKGTCKYKTIYKIDIKSIQWRV